MGRSSTTATRENDWLKEYVDHAMKWRGKGIPPTILSQIESYLAKQKAEKGDTLSLKDVIYLDTLVWKAQKQAKTIGDTSKAKVVDKDLAAIVKNTLSQIRPVGPEGRKHEYVKQSNRKIKTWLDDATDFLPSDWVLNSIDSEFLMLTKKVNRGYYRHSLNPDIEAIFASSVDRESSESTVLHEFGHRVENTTNGVKDIEREFYQRRTEGETSKWLGPDYGYDEVAKEDKFSSAYMGRDYGRDSYEILSMGLEGVFYGNYELYDKDPEYFDLILGLLAAK